MPINAMQIVSALAAVNSNSRIQKNLHGIKKNFTPTIFHKVFDETIEQWIRSGSRTVLLERALSLALETYPCSMSVFGLLQGLLDRATFGGDILSRKTPTYCGMIVAIFHGSEKGWKVMPRPFIKARSLS